MFHGRLSAPLLAAEATRERLGLLMGGAKTGEQPAVEEASHAVGT
jgi:simple sugar transport system ATP-binding protein